MVYGLLGVTVLAIRVLYIMKSNISLWFLSADFKDGSCKPEIIYFTSCARRTRCFSIVWHALSETHHIEFHPLTTRQGYAPANVLPEVR